jgi:hypothetical protein
LNVAVDIEIVRRYGLPSTQRSPSPSSVRMLVFDSFRSARVGTFSSWLRIPSTNRPETRKLSASTRIAYGAFSAWTRTPAAAGPLSCAAERLISSFEFPSTSAVRSTRDGR